MIWKIKYTYLKKGEERELHQIFLNKLGNNK